MEKMNNMPIVTAKDLLENFEDIAKGTESGDLMVITDSLNPQYVLMSYERYLKVTNRLPENEKDIWERCESTPMTRSSKSSRSSTEYHRYTCTNTTKYNCRRKTGRSSG